MIWHYITVENKKGSVVAKDLEAAKNKAALLGAGKLKTITPQGGETIIIEVVEEPKPVLEPIRVEAKTEIADMEPDFPTTSPPSNSEILDGVFGKPEKAETWTKMRNQQVIPPVVKKPATLIENRRESIFVGDAIEVQRRVEDLLAKRRGCIKWICMNPDPMGKMVVFLVVEHDN